MTKNPNSGVKPQCIEVYSQINLREHEGVKAFLFGLVRGVFHSQVPAGCKRQIESISSILVGLPAGKDTFTLSLQLDNKRIEFSTAGVLDLDKPIVFVPHKDSNKLVPGLCILLNELLEMVESQHQNQYSHEPSKSK